MFAKSIFFSPFYLIHLTAMLAGSAGVCGAAATRASGHLHQVVHGLRGGLAPRHLAGGMGGVPLKGGVQLAATLGTGTVHPALSNLQEGKHRGYSHIKVGCDLR